MDNYNGNAVTESVTGVSVNRRRYQRGWVETQGAKGRKVYVGRWREEDGSKPKLVLGYCSEMSLSGARAKIEAHVCVGLALALWLPRISRSRSIGHCISSHVGRCAGLSRLKRAMTST